MSKLDSIDETANINFAVDIDKYYTFFLLRLK